MPAWISTEPIHWLVLVLAPLVSGAYFPPSVLPGWLQVVSAWLPQTYALDAIRKSVLGMPGGGGHDLASLAAFAAALLLTGALLFRLSLRVGRQRAAPA